MMSQPSRQATAASMALTQQLTVAQTGTDAVEVRYATRHPRTAFIETAHTGTAPLKKNWSYYKRTGSSWEDVDHIPPARLKLFVRPDLGLAAACAINKRYEQEQALADMHGWAQAMNRAKLRQVLAQRREVRERVEDYIGMRRPRTQQYARSGLQSPSTASSSMVALPESLVLQAFRSADEVQETSLEAAMLKGPGFETMRVGLEGLHFPRHPYDSRLSIGRVGRYVPQRVGGNTLAFARTMGASELGAGSSLDGSFVM